MFSNVPRCLILCLVIGSGGCTFYSAEESDIDACSLITQTEIERTLGVAAEQIRASSFEAEKPAAYKQAKCVYHLELHEGLSYRSASMFIEIDSAARFEEYKLNFIKLDDPTYATAPKTVKTKTIAVSGIGQGAVWVPVEGDMFDDSYIAFVKNDYAVKIEIPFVKRGIAEIGSGMEVVMIQSAYPKSILSNIC